MKRLVLLGTLLLMLAGSVKAQFTYGTTGLLHMPTADMQRDKTFMFGGGFLNKYATPTAWDYNTWNYYINITFFPWFEVAYTCTIFDYWSDRRKVHVINQDRSFHLRFRIWKEGWWKNWMPQILVGVNDPGTSAHKDGWGDVLTDDNGFFNRYYIAATKHLSWYGDWGIHATYMNNKHIVNKINGVALGVDYSFALPATSTLNKAINGLNLMAEYDSKFFNVGAKYTLWKDHINIVGELRECKYPSVGVYFKVHLK